LIQHSDFVLSLQLLQEKYQRLEEMCGRKDQALSQTKMVLKFRESTIKKLEKVQKNHSANEKDDKDDIIVCTLLHNILV